MATLLRGTGSSSAGTAGLGADLDLSSRIQRQREKLANAKRANTARRRGGGAAAGATSGASPTKSRGGRERTARAQGGTRAMVTATRSDPRQQSASSFDDGVDSSLQTSMAAEIAHKVSLIASLRRRVAELEATVAEMDRVKASAVGARTGHLAKEDAFEAQLDTKEATIEALSERLGEAESAGKEAVKRERAANLRAVRMEQTQELAREAHEFEVENLRERLDQSEALSESLEEQMDLMDQQMSSQGVEIARLKASLEGRRGT